MQFTKNQKFTLRAVAVYEDSKGGMKVGEPSQGKRPGAVSFEDGVEVEALESLGGGEWSVLFPDGTIGRCSPNKIMGSASGEKYLQGKGGKQQAKGNGHQKDPISAYKAQKAHVEKLEKDLEAARAALRATKIAAVEYKKSLEDIELTNTEAPQGIEEMTEEQLEAATA